jgi:MFS family permease
MADLGWRAPFWLYAVSLLVLPIAARTVRDTARPATQPVLVERSTPVVRYRPLAGIYAVALLATIIFFMAPTQLPFMLEDFNVSPFLVGVAVAASTASSAVVSVLYARARQRLSFVAITILSITLLGIGWIIVGWSGALPLVIVGALVGGLGVGLAVPNFNTWLAELASPRHRGRILGGLVTAIFLGQFLSPLIVAPVVRAVDIPAAFLLVGGAGLALALGALAVAQALDRRPRQG